MERVKRKILAEHRSLSKTRKKITDFAVNLDVNLEKKKRDSCSSRKISPTGAAKFDMSKTAAKFDMCTSNTPAISDFKNSSRAPLTQQKWAVYVENGGQI